MDIFVPKRKLWIPDNHIADMDLSPPGQDRMLRRNRMRCNLTPDILMMMGAAGSAISGDEISYAFDGTGDWLSIPDHADWDFIGSVADSRTMELWIKYASSPTGTAYALISHSESIGPNDFWLINVSNAAINFFAQSASVTILAANDVIGIPDTDWHHIAVIRILDEYGIYVDGTQTAYSQDTSTDTFAGKLGIGVREIDGWGAFPGNVDEIRMYVGNPFGAAPVVGLTDTITVPTSQHTSDANTTLLIHCGETKTGTTGSGATFTDSGNTGHTVTEVGNAIEDAVNYKW